MKLGSARAGLCLAWGVLLTLSAPSYATPARGLNDGFYPRIAVLEAAAGTQQSASKKKKGKGFVCLDTKTMKEVILPSLPRDRRRYILCEAR